MAIFLLQHKTNGHCCRHTIARHLFPFFAIVSVIFVLFLLDTKVDTQTSGSLITYKHGILSVSETAPKEHIVIPLFDGWKHLRTFDGKAAYQISVEQQSNTPLSLLIPGVSNDSQVFVQCISTSPNRPFKNGRSLLCTRGWAYSLPADQTYCVQINSSLYDSIQKELLPFPILGQHKNICSFIFLRLIFYSLLFFCSVVIFIVLFVLSNLCRDKMAMISCFCAAAFFFVLHSGSSFFWMLTSCPSVALSFLRKSSILFMLFFIVLSDQTPSNLKRKKSGLPIPALFSLFMCTLACFHPLFLSFADTNIYDQYTSFVRAGAMFLALYLIFSAIRTLYRGILHYFLQCANILLGLSILFELLSTYFSNFLLPGRYLDFCCLLLLLFYCLEILFFGYQRQVGNASLTKHLAFLDARWTKQQISLDAEKQKLLTNAAHNLKAPLSTMHMYLDMMRDLNIRTTAELEPYLKIMESKNAELKKRVSELSTFLTLERLSSKKEPLLLSVFLKDFYQIYKADADASGIYFVLNPPNQDALIYGDFQRLQSVLENLFINALDFTPFEGEITLSAKTEQSWVSIFLQDTGCGISQEILPHIFDFGVSKRVENEQTRGIGLYCARLIIREHGGDITVLSSSEEGTKMHVKLPRIR